MITSLRIDKLRGIFTGTLAGLEKLTVLVGPNGCGKSTVLDALHLALAPNLGDAFEEVVRRRNPSEPSARWLFTRGHSSAAVQVRSSKAGHNLVAELLENGRARQHAVPGAQLVPVSVVDAKTTTLSLVPPDSAELQTAKVLFDDHDVAHARTTPMGNAAVLPQSTLIDLRCPSSTSLGELHSDAFKAGRARDIDAVLKPLLGEHFEEARVLTEHGQANVHLGYGKLGSVPLTQSGDGIRGLFRLACQLGATQGIALIEEPESHQHPRAIRQSATVIVAAMKAGLQIVLTTHSMELIDALISECAFDGNLDQFSVMRLALNDGVLKSVVSSGEEAQRVRESIALELR